MRAVGTPLRAPEGATASSVASYRRQYEKAAFIEAALVLDSAEGQLECGAGDGNPIQNPANPRQSYIHTHLRTKNRQKSVGEKRGYLTQAAAKYNKYLRRGLLGGFLVLDPIQVGKEF